MAKELFITQWFSNEMRIAGEALIDRLDQSDAHVAAAFWLLNAEEKTWELIIASKLIKMEGPKNYYKRINTINELAEPDKDIISLHNIRVSKLNHPIIKALQNSVLKKSLIANTRLGNNRIGGIYIEDAYIYRMDWQAIEADAE
jgi:hypothetical protein